MTTYTITEALREALLRAINTRSLHEILQSLTPNSGEVVCIEVPDYNAAPDLLEALVMVRDADDDCKRDGLPIIPCAARARIDAAIAKTTGKAS